MKNRVAFVVSILLLVATWAVADWQASEKVRQEVAASLLSDVKEAKIGALDWLLRDAKARSSEMGARILELCSDPAPEVRSRAVKNLRWLAESNPEAKKKVYQLLTGEDKTARLEALSLAREWAKQGSDLTAYLPALIQHSDADTAIAGLAAMREQAGFHLDPDLPAAAMVASKSNDPRVRNAAAETLMEYVRRLDADRTKAFEALSDTAKVEPSLGPKIAALAPKTDQAPPTESAPLFVTIPSDAPDLTYFAAFIQPDLAAERDGESCMSCHGERGKGGRYLIAAPDEQGRYSLQQTLTNYQSTLAVKAKFREMATAPHGGSKVVWSAEALDAWIQGEKLTAALQGLLDYDYYREKVEPLFVELGSDGSSCATCHNTHAVFNLKPLPSNGQYGLAESRHNYANALKVIDVDDPSRSLMLLKPISPRQTNEDTGFGHAGGVRWQQGANSEQWKLVYEWIRRRTVR